MMPSLHKRGNLHVLITVALLFSTSSLWLARAASTDSEPSEGPIIPPAAQGEQCVADTALMRTDHMELLNHQRDETVLDGVRGEPFSLVGCVNCHAQTRADGTPVRIDEEGQFCQSCHAFAAVKIDCFTCHAAIPEQEEIIGLMHRNNAQVASTELLNQHLAESDNFSISANRYRTDRHGKQQADSN